MILLYEKRKIRIYRLLFSKRVLRGCDIKLLLYRRLRMTIAMFCSVRTQTKPFGGMEEFPRSLLSMT